MSDIAAKNCIGSTASDLDLHDDEGDDQEEETGQVHVYTS